MTHTTAPIKGHLSFALDSHRPLHLPTFPEIQIPILHLLCAPLKTKSTKYLYRYLLLRPVADRSRQMAPAKAPATKAPVWNDDGTVTLISVKRKVFPSLIFDHLRGWRYWRRL